MLVVFLNTESGHVFQAEKKMLESGENKEVQILYHKFVYSDRCIFLFPAGTSTHFLFEVRTYILPFSTTRDLGTSVVKF